MTEGKVDPVVAKIMAAQADLRRVQDKVAAEKAEKDEEEQGRIGAGKETRLQREIRLRAKGGASTDTSGTGQSST